MAAWDYTRIDLHRVGKRDGLALVPASILIPGWQEPLINASLADG